MIQRLEALARLRRRFTLLPSPRMLPVVLPSRFVDEIVLHLAEDLIDEARGGVSIGVP